MKKRIISTMLSLSVLMGVSAIMPIGASAATSGTCGENLTWVLDDAGKLTISGIGEMWDWGMYGSDVAPWYEYNESITKVVIEDGVRNVGGSAFGNCASLTSITIPDSIASIGDEAFSSCYSLASITIPDSVTSIGDYAFSRCSGLTSITLGDNVTSIGKNVFFSCYSLTSITISDSVTSIGEGAFYNCSSLISIVIPESVDSIDTGVFIACDGLENIYYTGSEEQWNAIKVEDEALQSYNIVFNYDPITVTYNSERIIFDQVPVIEEGRTLVPLRAIFEKLGAEVGWDGNTQTVTATKGETQISLQINSTEMYVNGNAKVLDVPAKIVGNRTMVPVRAISEAFGCNVNWDGDSRTVIITQ